VQVFEYGVALKLNDGNYLLKQLFMMLKLHCCLDMTQRGGAYAQSIVMQILILLYQKQYNTPAWQMFVSQPSVFNEEAGEMTFSQLARSVCGDTQQRKIAHMNMLYMLLHIYGDVEIDTLSDVKGSAKEASSRRKINPKGPEVEAVVAFMKTLFRQLRAKKVMVYDGTDASSKRVYAHAHLKPLGQSMPYMGGDMMAVLCLNLDKAKDKFMKTAWAAPYFNIWPECATPAGGVRGAPVFAEDDDDDDDTQPHRKSVVKDKDKDYIPEPDSDFEPEPERHDEKDVVDEADEEKKHGPTDPPVDPAMMYNDSSEEEENSEEQKQPLYGRGQGTLSYHNTYCAVDGTNILTETRRERGTRGYSRPNPDFPMVYTIQTKRSKKRK